MIKQNLSFRLSPKYKSAEENNITILIFPFTAHSVSSMLKEGIYKMKTRHSEIHIRTKVERNQNKVIYL